VEFATTVMRVVRCRRMIYGEHTNINESGACQRG
jgi:hypothetical protein